MSNLLQSIEIFRVSNRENIQLDIFRRKEIWLQVIKAKDLDIKKWNFEPSDDHELIIVVFFHHSKTNNGQNWKRFRKSVFYNQAEAREIGVMAYLIPVSEGYTNVEIKTLLHQILRSIYGLTIFLGYTYEVNIYDPPH